MINKHNDAEIISRLSSVYPAVVADIMDRMGYTNQVMHPRVQPIRHDVKMAGRCLPVSVRAVYEVSEGSPYDRLLDSVEALSVGDIYVAAVQGDAIGAAWGELLSTAALGSGGLGAVIDGAARDIGKIHELGFPLFCAAKSPADSRGRIDVEYFDQSIRCAGVQVDPGDYIVGDWDGVVVIPSGIVTDVVVEAEHKSSGEDEVRGRLLAGESVRKIFEETGIL